MDIKKILLICSGNVGFAVIVLSVFLDKLSIAVWIQILIIFFAIIFLSLLILRSVFEKFKNNIVRYGFTLLLAFFSSVISFTLYSLTGGADPHDTVITLETIGGTLVFSMFINIFIVFWAWILAGTIVYYIYYCQYNDTSWMED